MCVGYTGLNKACPKVPYPLPRIDQIVDSTAGCENMSFLDACSGYHQIRMKESDQLATSFITPFGMHCYVTMPFSLRNTGATYQRCMNHVFGEHIGRTVEAYVDDIVVKTRKASDLLSDLEVTFRCLKAKGVKLNPEKCVFEVPRGMLLGFIVSERGIEANPEKIAAITSMGPIKDLKGMQRVMGCLAALSRFISHLGERGLPLCRLGANNGSLGSLLPRPASTLHQDRRHTQAQGTLGPARGTLGSVRGILGMARGTLGSARGTLGSAQGTLGHPRARHYTSRRSEAGSRLIKTGRPRTCNISTEESYPSTEPKLSGWRGAPSRSSCWEMGRSSTTAAPQASSSDASPSQKVRNSYERYTRGLAAITQHLEPLSETLSGKVSTGRRQWPTPLELSAPAKGVSSTQGRPTCLLRLCRPYPSPGLLLCGVWTSSAPCRRHPGATRTCWSPSTNSPSGSRSDP
jgi:hypothetical protein